MTSEKEKKALKKKAAKLNQDIDKALKEVIRLESEKEKARKKYFAAQEEYYKLHNQHEQQKKKYSALLKRRTAFRKSIGKIGISGR